MKKKVLSLALAVFMLLSLMPVSVMAEGESSGTYTDDNGIGYTLANGVLTVSGEGVCGSTWKNYFDKSAVTEVVLKDGVTGIGDSAFSGCSAFTSITIPDSVASIGWNAFRNCSSLESITIPDNVTSIGDWTFDGCSSLTSVTVGNGMTDVDAFTDCESLAEINVSPDNASFSTVDGAVYNKEKTEIIMCPKGKSGSISIPDNVTGIADDAFYDCSLLESITIPDSVTSIGNYAFYNTAYYNNEANWEDGVLYIGKCLIKAKDELSGDYSIKEGTRLVATAAFYGCNLLESISIPDSVTSIGDSAFCDCLSLTSITVPDSVTSIGERAFRGCSALESISIPDGVTKIGDDAFSDCTALTDITIPDSVTSIGSYAFFNCSSLTSISIPDSVTEIGDGAFYYCSSLESITISDSVTSVGGSAFYNTAYYNNEANWENSVLYIDNCLIKAKEDLSGAYSVKDGTRPIASSAFYYCESLTSITIPDSVTSIGGSAFSYCSSLESITIPDSVTSINWYAFSCCSSLESLTIPDSVTSIAYGSFIGCKALTSLSLPDNVTSIDYLTFDGCSSLTSVTIPDSVTSIGSYAFSGCDSLKDVYYGGTQEQWNAIDIYRSWGSNAELENATIHYSSAPTPAVKFTDVPDGAYYAKPVAWAVDRGITGGYTNGTFKPMDICTRAQIVTFIWRANNSPEPAGTSQGFTDVKEGTYYYKAVLWAAEQGITGGFNDGGFHPDELVTRAQAMTFLWRANGQPAVPEGTVNTFKDVPETAYYHDAVLWAVANGVTGGYDATTFGSMDGCTRAQIVTFLYRDMAE